MSVPMSQVLATTRTYLNDDSASFFPDPVLVPKVQEAHREMQLKLWLIGSPVVRGLQTDVLIVTNVAGTSALAATLDLLFPFALQEAPSPAKNPYIPMTEIETIPPKFFPIGPSLVYWVWDAVLQQILFPACNADNVVSIQYRRQVNVPVISTDPIGVLSGELYLAPRAAAIAAGAVGNKALSDTLTAQAEENFSDVILANRGQQKPSDRP